MSNKKLRVFEAFAGVGAQRMALKNIGVDFEVVGISEINKWSLNSYNAIHGHCPNYGDISLIDPKELPEFDLFTYSFPCQDLSVVGEQKGLGKGTRSGLLYECEKIIEEKKPKYLLLENVKNLVCKKFKKDFDKWLEYLEGLGYTNYWDILNAKDFGIPQNRERVFVVSILDDKQGFKFPKKQEQTKMLIDFLQPEQEVEDKFYYGDYREYIITNFEEGIINSNCLGAPKNEVVKIGTFTDSPFKQCLALLGSNGIAKCLLGSYYHNNLVTKVDGGYRLRRLTPLECWRLMGFEDSYYKAVVENTVISVNQLYRQAGNSIVVPVLEGIFKNLFL